MPDADHDRAPACSARMPATFAPETSTSLGHFKAAATASSRRAQATATPASSGTQPCWWPAPQRGAAARRRSGRRRAGSPRPGPAGPGPRSVPPRPGRAPPGAPAWAAATMSVLLDPVTATTRTSRQNPPGPVSPARSAASSRGSGTAGHPTPGRIRSFASHPIFRHRAMGGASRLVPACPARNPGPPRDGGDQLDAGGQQAPPRGAGTAVSDLNSPRTAMCATRPGRTIPGRLCYGPARCAARGGPASALAAVSPGGAVAPHSLFTVLVIASLLVRVLATRAFRPALLTADSFLYMRDAVRGDPGRDPAVRLLVLPGGGAGVPPPAGGHDPAAPDGRRHRGDCLRPAAVSRTALLGRHAGGDADAVRHPADRPGVVHPAGHGVLLRDRGRGGSAAHQVPAAAVAVRRWPGCCWPTPPCCAATACR